MKLRVRSAVLLVCFLKADQPELIYAVPVLLTLAAASILAVLASSTNATPAVRQAQPFPGSCPGLVKRVASVSAPLRPVRPIPELRLQTRAQRA